MSFKDHIAERFALNIRRVQGLVDTYGQLRGKSSDRREARDDVLRAAVVLLHATLEDLVRSLEELCLELPGPEHLKTLNFPRIKEQKGIEKLSVLELARRYPGKTVEQIVRHAIADHLEHLSYSNLPELKEALRRLNVPADALTRPIAADLAALMKRRHWIAHRVDVRCNNPNNFLYLEGVQAIDRELVVSWLGAIDGFGREVLKQFKEPVT